MDAVWLTLAGRRGNIYGFDYDPEVDPPVSLDQCRVLLRNREDSDFPISAAASQAFLNNFELELGWEPTKMSLCEKPPKGKPVVAFLSPKEWMKAPPMLSLYSLLTRVGMTFDARIAGVWDYMEDVKDGKAKTIQSNDSRYLRRAWPTIKEVLGDGGARFTGTMEENWPSHIREIILHEDGGIVTLATEPNVVKRNICSHWFSQKEKQDEETTE
jgi:hypothetical protein